LDENATRLDRQWNPADHIETVWHNAQECCRFAASGNNPISENTAVQKTLAMFEKSGVFANTIRNWRKRPDPEWTWPNLKTHFTRANRERHRLLTSERGGYQSTNSAAQAATNAATAAATNTNAAAATALAAALTGTPPQPSSNPTSFHYCWSHGLSCNPSHTSLSCNNQATVQSTNATLSDMKGGNNNIARNRNKRPIFWHTLRS
jgi:hypothetical protein